MDKLATITPYATGATIKDLVNEALITAIRNGRDVITWPDVIKAKQLKELGRRKTWSTSSANGTPSRCTRLSRAGRLPHPPAHGDRHRHDREGQRLPRDGGEHPAEDQFTRWRSEYETDIPVSLASLAGERMFFDRDSSSGVSGDLESATTVASYMEGFWAWHHGVLVLHGQAAGGRLARRRPGRCPEEGAGSEAQVRHALADRIEDS